MRIKIKTASKEAEIAIICMLRTQLGQVISLTYSSGMHIMLEQISANAFSPLFPLDDQNELDKLLKLSINEKGVFMNTEVEKISEAETLKMIDQPIYSIFYKKKDQYFDLIKFESEALETSSNVFFQNFSPNLFVMQPVDIENTFELDDVLDRIHQVGIKNITKLEKEFLQRISKHE
jgi:hypothetical protein